ALARWILGGNSCWTIARVALLGLDAADREHEAAARVTPVSAESHDASHVEGRRDLSRCADLDLVANVGADESRVHEGQAISQRHAEVIHELERRGAGAAFLAIDDDEVWGDAGLQHRLDHSQELPGMTDAELESGRLAAREATQLCNEVDKLERCR